MTGNLCLLAMHGWCGDPSNWDPWHPHWQTRGWQWSCANQGYGPSPIQQPHWPEGEGLKVLIAHSLGPHLVPAAVLRQAQAVVLLTSFGRFVPEGREGRRLEVALQGMAEQLAGPDPQAMLQAFLERVCAPEAVERLQHTPANQPLSAPALERLRRDLALLTGTSGLPAGFPEDARVLLVQAGRDQIVAPAARHSLEEALPQADVLTLATAGHALLGTPVITLVNAWLEALLSP